MTKILTLPSTLLRLYLLKSEIARLLFLSVSFSVVLLLVRIFCTGSFAFIFLAWNLFLAFLPYLISIWVAKRPSFTSSKWRFAIVFIPWLLLIPNSFYILTDLFHLQHHWNAPLWYDLLLILSFAWNGLMMGILSIREMEKLIQPLFGKTHELLFLYPIMWLNALGVFIGRYLRFNSWDIITDPLQLIIDIFRLVTNPVLYKDAWGMVFCFSFFMTLLYLMIKRISKLIW